MQLVSHVWRTVLGYFYGKLLIRASKGLNWRLSMAKLACVDKREGLVVALPCPTWWLASNVGEQGGIC